MPSLTTSVSPSDLFIDSFLSIRSKVKMLLSSVRRIEIILN